MSTHASRLLISHATRDLQEWGSDLKLDASDDDGMINLQSWPTVKGMYMPDAITTFKRDGTRCESGTLAVTHAGGHAVEDLASHG